MEKIIIRIECNTCGGSGLFAPQHFKEKGFADICITCKGKCYQEKSYIPFVEKKKISGIKFVRNYEKDNKITYAEFLSGKMP